MLSGSNKAVEKGLTGRLEHYRTWLLRKLRGRFEAERGEDLVQETFARASSSDISQVRHPRAYLLRIATNVARDQFRRQAVRGGNNLVALDDMYESEELGLPSDQEQAVLLKQVILSMPELYRCVFLLSRFEGLTYGEIAARLEISVKTVEWRMARALEHCVAQLRA